MDTNKLTILYDTLREGKYRVDQISLTQKTRRENAWELVSEGYLKDTKTRGYHDVFKLTAKGKKFIKDYDNEIRKDAYSLPKYLTG